MRQSQQSQQSNKRVRGRGRKVSGSCNRIYESNGPDVKIRGTAPHIAERYTTLSRDANVSGNYVIAENYMQHAEHYLRFIAAMRLQQGLIQPCAPGSGETTEQQSSSNAAEPAEPAEPAERSPRSPNAAGPAGRSPRPRLRRVPREKREVPAQPPGSDVVPAQPLGSDAVIEE